eukprot:12228470-Alexandrium_andersonii.AAC.1
MAQAEGMIYRVRGAGIPVVDSIYVKLKRVLPDAELASLMTGLEALGPSPDEDLGLTGPPPSALTSGAAAPRFRE